ncbi:unnamed protein product [Thelazia callipaeda]|uniref:USP domain-containing protein n=1 Tax=Thelazia callipaeda TaxID=103827 RepID=A0A0N5CLU2_THECL|nr:unnamed protein product [Thelazia callipaeda]
MTILSVVGGKGSGPIEAEEPERTSKSIYVVLLLSISLKGIEICLAIKMNALTAEELVFFNEVKNFLGNSVNEQILVQAIKSHGSQTQSHSSGSNVLNDVISIYFDRMESVEKPTKQVRFDEHLDVLSPAPSMSRPYSFNTRGTAMEGSKEVIDLTSDEDKSVNKWSTIPRSVLGNREEQDVIKAIEESLKDNQNIVGYSSFIPKDPDNPHERRRDGFSPVGLKNIGNTCWFNVIVQTLYHIPYFRQMLFDASNKSKVGLVLEKTDTWENESSSVNELNRSALTTSLLLSFRKLAACLKASSRAYVDPTDVLKIISELNTSLNKAAPCIGIQQDATEMLLRLIEWLELAFKDQTSEQTYSTTQSLPSISSEDVMDVNDENMAPSGSNSEELVASSHGTSCNKSNDADLSLNSVSDHPFNALFYGSHIEIRPNAVGISSPLKLGNALQMINLDVTYDNLYDSLEAYHLSDAPDKELWFESLPPVIIFSLVRFSYKNGQTEKIHSQFQFPRDLYMDRYLYRNRVFVNEKRFERNSFKKRLESITTELERWEKFPAGDTKVPLPSLIDAVAKYTSSATNDNVFDDFDSCKQQPMEVCDENASHSFIVNEMQNANSGLNSNNEESILSYPQLDKSIIPVDVDINAVTSFLQSLSSNAQEKINELQKEADVLKRKIDSIFDIESMREALHVCIFRLMCLFRIIFIQFLQEPYRLHSVIVHEGEANVGHYWAYIASSPLSSVQNNEVSWRKFNDKSVDPATWQQIEEDSFGSRRACSAYCLVYTRKKCEDSLYGGQQGKQKQPGQLCTGLVDGLPCDLKIEVSTDNAWFDAEIMRWDAEHNVELGPENKILSDPSNDEELLRAVSFKGVIDINGLSRRHYEHAARFFGLFMIKSVFQLITHYMTHYETALRVTNVLYSDRLMFMIDWASVFGISLSNSATTVFILRLLMNMDGIKYSKLIEACEKVAGKVVTDDPSSELILNNAHVLYEAFCQMIAVMNDILKKLDHCSSLRKLDRIASDIQQARLLCVSIHLMDRINMYAAKKSSDPELEQFFNLVHNGLLIIYVVGISRCIIDYMESESDDVILIDHDNFIDKEYKAMIVRLHNMKNSGSERSIQYVISIWNQLLSNSNGLKRVPWIYQKIVDASEQKTSTIMPASKLNVRAGNSGYDLYSMKETAHSKLGIRNVEDLNKLALNVVQGKFNIANAE